MLGLALAGDCSDDNDEEEEENCPPASRYANKASEGIAVPQPSCSHLQLYI